MDEINKTKEKIKCLFKKKYAFTAIYAIIILLYLICLNTVCRFFEPTVIQSNINILSMITLLVSIIVMERTYKNGGKDSFACIEFLILSTYLLLMNHISKIYNYDIQTYIQAGTVSFILYYFFKMAIIYTKEHKEQLNNLSDIKQIIKEEPIKKETKRKNIKQ